MNKTFVTCCNPRATLDERINARGKSQQQHIEKLRRELVVINEKIDNIQEQITSCDTYIRFHRFLHKTRNDPNSTQLQQAEQQEAHKTQLTQQLLELKRLREIMYSNVH